MVLIASQGVFQLSPWLSFQHGIGIFVYSFYYSCLVSMQTTFIFLQVLKCAKLQVEASFHYSCSHNHYQKLTACLWISSIAVASGSRKAWLARFPQPRCAILSPKRPLWQAMGFPPKRILLLLAALLYVNVSLPGASLLTSLLAAKGMGKIHSLLKVCSCPRGLVFVSSTRLFFFFLVLKKSVKQEFKWFFSNDIWHFIMLVAAPWVT